MKAKLFVVILGALFFVSLMSFDTVKTVENQKSEWLKLGSRKVNYALDQDVINVGLRDGKFKRLKLQVTGGSLNMHKMIVHYGNGTRESIALKYNFTRRAASRTIDLKGNQRIIRKIVFVYDSKNRSRQRATMHVFGKR
jgi:hypothetical protein